MYRVFIDGKEGTTGLRIHERIATCADIELLALPESMRKDATARRDMIHASDVTFLCLPDAAAKEAVELAKGSSARLIDASTAHRTQPGWIYGFAELSALHRAAIETATRVAVPGCHASGFIALAYPLLQAGILDSNALLSCFSLTGYSGGGKPMIAAYTDGARSTAYESPRQYALGQQHKHLPEMQLVTGLAQPPVFSPIVAGFYAGMEVTIPLHAAQLKKRVSPADLFALYTAHYAGEPLMQVRLGSDEDGFLPSDALAGKDSMEITAYGNEERMLLVARYDNLGKGASGAAIQCMNILLGRPEAANLAY